MKSKKWMALGLSSLTAALLAVPAMAGNFSGTQPYPTPPGGPVVTPAICNRGFQPRFHCDKPTGVCVLVEEQDKCSQKCLDANGRPTNVLARIVKVECVDAN